MVQERLILGKSLEGWRLGERADWLATQRSLRPLRSSPRVLDGEVPSVPNMKLVEQVPLRKETMTTIDKDINETTNDGKDFTADFQSWTIAAGILVQSTQAEGVASDYNGSILDNFGIIFSNVEDGVAFEKDTNNGLVINERSGTIIGGDAVFWW